MPYLLPALMGLTATLAQDVVPFAAVLGDEQRRGHIVGTIMTGLLGGILLSRVLSGAISELAGWRAVFYCAAGAMLIVSVLLFTQLPSTKPTSDISYPRLLGSLGKLFVQHASVRLSTFTQGLLAMGFSAFWTTLSLMLKDSPLELGSGIAGLFGIAGAMGVLMAPKFGKLSDSIGPLRLTKIGAILVFRL
ncbi:MFS transporter [Vibrio olivae]